MFKNKTNYEVSIRKRLIASCGINPVFFLDKKCNPDKLGIICWLISVFMSLFKDNMVALEMQILTSTAMKKPLNN
jgi:hypothetical protein